MTDPADHTTPAIVTRAKGDVVTFTHRGEVLTGVVLTVGPERVPFAKRHTGVFSSHLGIRVPGRDWMVWADSDDTSLAREGPITVTIEWTHRDYYGKHHGTMRFTLPTALDESLSGQGKAMQWQLSATPRHAHITADNTDGTEHHQVSGTLDTITRAAAAWLGLTGPLTIAEAAVDNLPGPPDA
ncbi:hypothetical protein AB0958_18645 [Streptomyces sp. NPDC006655]|uniref:hypothetical protein n=1 Tax=Streptomyces sp. NPDC006655 TaxID=3156898 RepID=UPI003452029B